MEEGFLLPFEKLEVLNKSKSLGKDISSVLKKVSRKRNATVLLRRWA